MKKLPQKISSLFLATLMLAFTAGISVYKHYCGCTNQQISSLFVEVTCSDKPLASCCSTTSASPESCCSSQQGNTCEHDTACDVEDCCKTEIDIIQIESEFQVSQEKLIAADMGLLMAIVVSDIFSDTETKLFAGSFYTDPPPPVYGRQFLTAVHQLKLDIPVC